MMLGLLLKGSFLWFVMSVGFLFVVFVMSMSGKMVISYVCNVEFVINVIKVCILFNLLSWIISCCRGFRV